MTPRSKRSKVSVAMCTHEGAAFVAEQLESVLEQTRAPDEIVISDDGSTDGTIRRISEVVEEARVPVRLLENDGERYGYRANFECAVRACSGDLIFLADQDDVWLPEKIETMLPAFSSDQTMIVHSDAVLSDVRLRSRGTTIFERHPVLGDTSVNTPLGVVRGLGIPGCTMAFRSRLTEVLVPFSRLWGHDLWLALIGGSFGDIVPVPKTLMLYRRHGGGAGPSRHLDAGPVGRARVGMHKRRLVDYERDLEKWQEAVARLEDAIAGLTSRDPERQRAERFLEEYRRRRDLAVFRKRLQGRARPLRVGPVLRRVGRGDYKRYLRPVTSPVKDILL